MIEREQDRKENRRFHEGRDEDGNYVMPKALRINRPELLRRPIVNFDRSELVTVEDTGLTRKGARFDAKRLSYMF